MGYNGTPPKGLKPAATPPPPPPRRGVPPGPAAPTAEDPPRAPCRFLLGLLAGWWAGAAGD